MQAKIFFITLAVDDLNRSVAFYRDGLGWPSEGIVGQEFHDVVTGDNSVLCPTGVFTGYQAGPGWDPVTGWGSPNAQDLVPLLAHAASSGA